MSVRKIQFFQAECDYCGKKVEYNSTQFSGDDWQLVPRAYGWLVEYDNWNIGWRALCPTCKSEEEERGIRFC